jgi:hypothetical protein
VGLDRPGCGGVDRGGRDCVHAAAAEGEEMSKCVCGHKYHEGVCPQCLGEDGVVVGDAVLPERSQQLPTVACINARGQKFVACAQFLERWPS